MNVQELLTYIEELSFKNSMFGYDKDDVDIQLDKICDELEAIVAAKDNEIRELKSEVSAAQASAIAAAEEAKAAKNAAAATAVEEDADMKIVGEPEVEVVSVAEEDPAEEATVEDIDVPTLPTLDEEALLEAESEIKKLQAENEALEARVKELDAALDEAMKQLDSAEVAKVNAEARADEAELSRPPKNQDEAYTQYLRNADLLCRQLDDIESKRESVIAAAEAQAETIFADANEQAQTIISEANNDAKRINEQAEARLSRAEEEIRRIREEGQKKADEEQKRYEELTAKKEALIEYLNTVTGEIKTLIDKSK